MLKEQNAERHRRIEQELSQLCYRRLLLTRELETVDKRIPILEGAMSENEAAGKDVETQEAIDKSKEAEKA